MRRLFTAALAFLAGLTITAQKVSVCVTKPKNIAITEWQILDENYLPVFAGSEYFMEDSVCFSLEAEKRYFMEVSVSGLSDPDTSIYCLFINSEPILRIDSDISPGDHFFPFFTGLRQDKTKITGGTDASVADYPWQVFYESGQYTCGGSIISGDWIITAAHCTEWDNGVPIAISLMDVIVGSDNPRSELDGKRYKVKKVIRHEDYDHNSLNNDIALLQLDETINYQNATPIRLVSKIDSASGATDPGVMSWVTGYGLIKVSPQTVPENLQKVQLPIVSNAQASTVWQDINPSNLMAGFRTGNKDACNGDSGGPLVVPVDNEYKLAGIVSWGSSNCNTYGAYTCVSDFESWITSNTGIEISYTPPVPSGDSIICQGLVTSRYNSVVISGASAYEWQLLPAEAGTIVGNFERADVTWNTGFTGQAAIKLRVTKFGFASYWSALTVHIARFNKLVSQSADTVICAGEQVVLKVVSEGYNLNYSWLKDGDLIKSGTSPVLALRNTTKDSTGVYMCNITGSCGDPLSPEINLTVLPVTEITYISPDKEAEYGEDVTLKVTADGHNLLYQWQKDENEIPLGTSTELLLHEVNASANALYRVLASGSCGGDTSRNVYVYVTKNVTHTDPEIIVWPTVVVSEFSVALSSSQNYSLMLYNTSGKLVKVKHDCQFKTTLNITDLTRGVYILTVSGNKFRKTVKLIRN
ncbi:MAG: trypsin-like serine protease [Bacteroidales bacterium]|nr:trypsin-like serine protease [Bacteroidales bacterium]